MTEYQKSLGVLMVSILKVDLKISKSHGKGAKALREKREWLLSQKQKLSKRAEGVTC
ncbi:MAG: hypothetical protein ACK5NC_11310 [Vibrio sp.]